MRTCEPCPRCKVHAATFYVRRDAELALYRCNNLVGVSHKTGPCGHLFELPHPKAQSPEMLEAA